MDAPLPHAHFFLEHAPRSTPCSLGAPTPTSPVARPRSTVLSLLLCLRTHARAHWRADERDNTQKNSARPRPLAFAKKKCWPPPAACAAWCPAWSRCVGV